MSEYVFLFNLDSTITRQEILPAISCALGRCDQIKRLTESTMHDEVPYKSNFMKKIDLFKDIPVSKISRSIDEIELNDPLLDFIKKHQKRCYIVTSNLDIWIEKLIQRIGMKDNLFCSKAVQKGDYIESVLDIIDKNAVVSQMVHPCVAVGDENSDAEMIEKAEIGIGYGGVRDIANSVLNCANYAIYNEEKLVNMLERLI